jgi:hypothetical protein
MTWLVITRRFNGGGLREREAVRLCQALARGAGGHVLPAGGIKTRSKPSGIRYKRA